MDDATCRDETSNAGAPTRRPRLAEDLDDVRTAARTATHLQTPPPSQAHAEAAVPKAVAASDEEDVRDDADGDRVTAVVRSLARATRDDLAVFQSSRADEDLDDLRRRAGVDVRAPAPAASAAPIPPVQGPTHEPTSLRPCAELVVGAPAPLCHPAILGRGVFVSGTDRAHSEAVREGMPSGGSRDDDVVIIGQVLHGDTPVVARLWHLPSHGAVVDAQRIDPTTAVLAIEDHLAVLRLADGAHDEPDSAELVRMSETAAQAMHQI